MGSGSDDGRRGGSKGRVLHNKRNLPKNPLTFKSFRLMSTGSGASETLRPIVKSLVLLAEDSMKNLLEIADDDV